MKKEEGRRRQAEGLPSGNARSVTKPLSLSGPLENVTIFNRYR